MDFTTYYDAGKAWILTTGIQILIIILMAGIALRFTNFAAKKLFHAFTRGKEETELKKRADTLSSVVRYVLTILVLLISGMMLLEKVNIDIAPILAGAGVLGLAVGFGAQDLVKDIISGFYILLEDQVRVGDVVQINDHSGLVENVTLRMVILRDLSGSVFYIRNGDINVVKNMTKDFSFYVFDLGVAYRENVDEVIEAIKEVGAALRADEQYSSVIMDDVEVFGLDKFDDSAIVIKGRIKTLPIKQWMVGREFNRRIKLKFDELGIEIPFPQITLSPIETKEGDTNPFKLIAFSRDSVGSKPSGAGNGDSRGGETAKAAGS